MMSKKLVVLYSALVCAMILQLIMIGLKRADIHYQKPLMHAHHVNYSKVVAAANQLSTSPTSTQIISTNIIATVVSQPPPASKPLTLSAHSLTSKTQTVPAAKQMVENTKQQAGVKRFRPDDKMPFISEFDRAKEVKSVDVLLIILTYHKYFHRRDNIRKTWLDTCKRRDKIACWFFTDSLEAIRDPVDKKKILEEQKEHKDIIFTPIGNGIKFGERFLYLLMWGKANYDFKYIIRTDDDIMVCIDHLMWDLPNFPLNNVHYGWMHCQMLNVVYIDEGFSMYSSDLVERYLSQKGDRIMCHPFGDQQVAVWEHSLGLKGPDVYRPDNNRIHHHPPASYDKRIKTALNICDTFIAIHGVYKDDALTFWEKRGTGNFNKYPANKPNDFCPHYPNVNIEIFGGMYHHDPKLCSSNPRWALGHHSKYTGREK